MGGKLEGYIPIKTKLARPEKCELCDCKENKHMCGCCEPWRNEEGENEFFRRLHNAYKYKRDWAYEADKLMGKRHGRKTK